MKLFWILLFLCLFSVSLCEVSGDKMDLEKLKMTFCACQCCEERKQSCLRPSRIPDSYQCDLSQCTEGFCEVWEKAKCQKECFCNYCEAKLDKKDYRCMGFKNVPDHCTCKEKYDCKAPAKKQTPEELEKKMKDIKDKMNGKNPEGKLQGKCNMPCFCKRCKKKLPRSLREDCKRIGLPHSDCDCKKSTMACPDEDRMKNLQNFDKKRPGIEARQAIMTGMPMKIDPKWSPEELKSRRCTQQCYCQTCSETSDTIKENCEKLVSETIVDCECSEADKKCPDMHGKSSKEGGVDATCQMHCFCENCQADMRMSSMLRQSCNSNDFKQMKPTKDCDCSKTSCDMLDKLAEATKDAALKQREFEKSDEAKKMKKGRMKKKKNKKKIWDEL